MRPVAAHAADVMLAATVGAPMFPRRAASSDAHDEVRRRATASVYSWQFLSGLRQIDRGSPCSLTLTPKLQTSVFLNFTLISR